MGCLPYAGFAGMASGRSHKIYDRNHRFGAGYRIRLMILAAQQARIWRGVASAAMLLAAALCGIYAWQYRLLPGVPGSIAPQVSVPDWPQAGTDSSDWGFIRVGKGGAVPRNTRSAGRFLFRGIFFVYDVPAIPGAPPLPSARKAIIDDRQLSKQYIVQEGDTVSGVDVVRIFRDHIILRQDTSEIKLWLSFAGQAEAATVAEEEPQGVEEGLVAPAIGTENRFGRVVNERHRIFDRKKLMAYYGELLEEPDRLLAVFDSLVPVYSAEDAIGGYVLDVKGEGAFFRDAGMKPGDVVRRVNGMLMKNRHRAEYMVRQMVEGRANAFVIEVDREGQPYKLTYQVWSKEEAKTP